MNITHTTPVRPLVPYAGKEKRERNLNLGRAAGPSAVVIHDETITSLFADGFDTFEIAKRLQVRESQVANRLARLRDAGALMPR